MSQETIEDVWSWLCRPLQDLKQEPGESWESRRHTFLDKLGLTEPAQHPVVEQFIHQLDEMPADERDNLLGSDNLDTLAYELVHKSVPAKTTDPDGYDESAWHDFLATNLPVWNGTEDSWAQFAEWFTFHAGEKDLHAPAAAFVFYLQGMPNEDRVVTCAQYGVTIQASSPDAPADAKSLMSL